jgi:ABC-type nitrate/sulfonate/bicarbonate transport system, ATPase component
MIYFEQVNFAYQDKIIVKDFTFTLPAKGTTLLTGPSGCGKTTLLRLIAGLERPQSGTVIAPKTAFLFQENRLFPRRSALSHLIDVMSEPPAIAKEKAMALLAMVELENEADSLPAALSGGMQRRLTLARCFALHRPLYLLDEPFSGVDEQRRDRILTRLQNESHALLLIGHEEGLADRADKIFALNGPPVVATRTN